MQTHKIRQSPFRLISAILVVIFAVWGGLLWQQRAQRAAEVKRLYDAQAKLGKFSLAACLYAADHKETFPPADHWAEALRPYCSLSTETPPLSDGKARRVTLNKDIAGKSLESIYHPSSAILFFESVSNKPDTTADLEAIPKDDPTGMFAVTFTDGHGYPRAFGSRQELIDFSRKFLNADWGRH